MTSLTHKWPIFSLLDQSLTLFQLKGVRAQRLLGMPGEGVALKSL